MKCSVQCTGTLQHCHKLLITADSWRETMRSTTITTLHGITSLAA